MSEPIDLPVRENVEDPEPDFSAENIDTTGALEVSEPSFSGPVTIVEE
jgi:hypothetical protein